MATNDFSEQFADAFIKRWKAQHNVKPIYAAMLVMALAAAVIQWL